ncbi:squalene synthase HpnC [Palleronia marisminoris]|uniref:All-trans-phytoene synthase n=1 Tax=Palleronia marisminoris TaxID=315423 RepID=A0A1Y5S732_9RHOB|nr:squalene/phytoene synthase family protein [Palleronia marisminoris]SFG66379.1 squalene synthase HpnC [Palleronia marisminoris]SLN33995.1 All-trans-phytoene synthase [Palleronia marisminoris]
MQKFETRQGDAWSTGTGKALSAARKSENFPVASVLLPRDLRPSVLAFYDVVRSADDVADDPALSRETKLARLDLIDRALAGTATWQPAGALQLALAQAGRPGAIRHATKMLVAFRADAEGNICRDWEDLRAYCEHSAVPVGRFLLELHGEGDAPCAASDGLCVALQVLNHLQDLGSDWCKLRRLYLPLDWIEAEGASPDDLRDAQLTPALRRVLDRTLDATDAELARAAALPRLIRSRRLAAETRVILSLARHLSARLRREDPLASRVAVTRAAALRAGTAGLTRLVRA